ncbi:MAG: carboxypeptidase regulatory-like domain-containing protein [Planctomycetes bacterium]|nr:carboxypeptidase regulatory-like domain-containing protein [Planctomycetota bacterium]MCW8135931.1 carboxypeptidase regulatory-like domain-containing protein [Planctomycetota bacterium]
MANRLSPLNLALLLVTALALLFGAWGMYQSSQQPAPAANQLAHEVDHAPAGNVTTGGRAAAGEEAPGATNTRVPAVKSPAPQRPTEVAKPPAQAYGKPSDSGNASISGVVVFSDGKPAAGATVTCRRSNLDTTPPQVQDGDIDDYNRRIEEYIRRTSAETRRAATDEQGRFTFSGLDPELSYDLHASAPGGSGRQVFVAAGDKARILLAAGGSVRGRVVGPDGEPVKEFTIRHWPQGRQWEARSQSFNSSDGTFAIEGTGPIQLEATAEGLLMDQPAEADARQEGTEAVITLRLSQGASLSGVVRDKAGKPLPGATVTTGERNDNRWGGGRWDNTPRATTDSLGRYRLPSLKPGATTVRAIIGELTENQLTHLAAGANTLDFTVNTGATLALRLTSPDGKPVDADQVWFQLTEREWPRATRLPPREAGLAEFTGLHAGEYTLTILAAGFPVVTHKMTLAESVNELSLKLANGASLTGKVTTSSGAALQNASVRLRKQDEEGWGGWGTGRRVQLREDGKYKLGPAEPGQWLLELYVQNRGQPLYTAHVTLAEGDNTHDINVNTGATLVLTVLDESGNPVPRASVQLRGEQTHGGRANEAGVATIAFLPAGGYSVTANGNGKASQVLQVSLANGDNQYTLRMQAPNACRVTHIYPDSQAVTIGLQVGDLILEYNGQVISGWAQFGREARNARNAGDITMVIDRNGVQMTLHLKGGTVGIEGADAVR